jgi:hypothetical protein
MAVDGSTSRSGHLILTAHRFGRLLTLLVIQSLPVTPQIQSLTSASSTQAASAWIYRRSLFILRIARANPAWVQAELFR